MELGTFLMTGRLAEAIRLLAFIQEEFQISADIPSILAKVYRCLPQSLRTKAGVVL
jgi:hypothetical protein